MTQQVERVRRYKRSLERVRRYKRTYRNWISVTWAVHRKKQLIKLKLRNGLELEGDPLVATSMSFIVNFGGDIRRVSHELVEFVINGKSIIFYGWLQGDMLAISDYVRFDVKGKRVLDVGAAVGETAVYFALRGAREVVAFEPYLPISLSVRPEERRGERPEEREGDKRGGLRPRWHCKGN